MNFFNKMFRNRIRYAHPDTKLRIADYDMPFRLWAYYHIHNPFTLKTAFERDVSNALGNCSLDRFNVNYLDNKLTALYQSACADIDEQHVYRKKHALAIKTNRKAYISHIQNRIDTLETQNKILEAQLQQDGINI